MDRIEPYDFLRVHARDDGTARSSSELDALLGAVRNGDYTDVIFLGHGFRNDEGEAASLYTRFLQGFARHAAGAGIVERLAGRKYLAVGVFWPSKRFSEGPRRGDDGSVQGMEDDTAAASRERADAESELRDFLDGASPARRADVAAAFARLERDPDSIDAQDAFVAAVLEAVPFDDADGSEGLQTIRSRAGSEVLESLAVPVILPTMHGDDEGGVSAVGGSAAGEGDGRALNVTGFFRSVMGKAGQVLNMGTWYTMKARAGDVGSKLVADAVRRVQAVERTHGRATPRVHLVGHSLGGRMMASAVKALAADPVAMVQSLTLLEAAFSHYGFSGAAIDGSQPGFFREAIERGVVQGPLVSTFSYQDTVVGKAYAIASRLAGDNRKAVGDKDDQFGGIGRNGAQKTAEAVAHTLQEAGGRYAFLLGKVNDVDGSNGGIRDHSDVTNDRVTWAFTSAMAMT